MGHHEGAPQAGLGLADAIRSLRQEILQAQADATTGLRFPVESITVELQVVATREGSGKAGFKVPVVNLEVGAEGKLTKETTHSVTVVFGGPVDAAGAPIPVAQDSAEQKY